MAQVAHWAEGDFSDREKAALGYTERLYIDHQHIDQELFDELALYFTPEQVVELSWAIVSYMGYGRLIHSFGLTPGEHL